MAFCVHVNWFCLNLESYGSPEAGVLYDIVQDSGIEGCLCVCKERSCKLLQRNASTLLFSPYLT